MYFVNTVVFLIKVSYTLKKTLLKYKKRIHTQVTQAWNTLFMEP